jgi:hypothetical protein
MLDALTFVLFGKPFRNINKPTLVNSINAKDCVAEVRQRINTRTATVICGIDFQIGFAGRARSPLRAGLGKADDGAHGVKRPTFTEITFEITLMFQPSLARHHNSCAT